MYLIHILLPLKNNQGQPFGSEHFRTVADELTERFGGLTAHTRAPAEGLWKEETSDIRQDEIVIVEVMVEKLQRKWWRKYRRLLESRFCQEEIIVRAQQTWML